MKENIVLFGGGNQVQYTIDIIEKDNKYNIIGIIDSKRKINELVYGYKVIGRQEDILKLIVTYQIHGGLISIGDNWSRKLVSDYINKLKPNFNWVNAIHPSVIIGNNVKIGKGIIAISNNH